MQVSRCILSLKSLPVPENPNPSASVKSSCAPSFICWSPDHCKIALDKSLHHKGSSYFRYDMVRQVLLWEGSKGWVGMWEMRLNDYFLHRLTIQRAKLQVSLVQGSEGCFHTTIWRGEIIIDGLFVKHMAHKSAWTDRMQSFFRSLSKKLLQLPLK